ncbi:hypothetical protein Q8G28_14655 [Lysinibacillus capsici]|uniref:hypothetical protein n=1 Tax=Lysinibacillus capsici TaxID=2115968 RepID=UPI0027312E2F|nr:hypothetical protein [Lysinibacillus capsici]MDP1394621.1 hypothetical protein [Lysinibacillus capsici]MDP1415316.1 hypothetical protein [Lysinibacillus capsici]MDP1430984.1 hypothetical protein [Lysinibacillus capsici]
MVREKKFFKIIILLFLIILVHENSVLAESAESNVNDAISTGTRWPDSEDDKQWLTITMPEGGVRIVDQKNQQEFLAIDSYGGIYLNGDVYINGTKLDRQVGSNSIKENVYNRENVILVYISTILFFLSVIVVLIYMYKRSVDRLAKKINLLETTYRKEI